MGAPTSCRATLRSRPPPATPISPTIRQDFCRSARSRRAGPCAGRLRRHQAPSHAALADRHHPSATTLPLHASLLDRGTGVGRQAHRRQFVIALRHEAEAPSGNAPTRRGGSKSLRRRSPGPDTTCVAHSEKNAAPDLECFAGRARTGNFSRTRSHAVASPRESVAVCMEDVIEDCCRGHVFYLRSHPWPMTRKPRATPTLPVGSAAWTTRPGSK